MNATTTTQTPLRSNSPLMNTTLRNLAVLVLALAALSVWVYSQSTRRGTDLVAGSDFIKGLDINKVAGITLSFGAPSSATSPSAGGEGGKAKASVVLSREGEGFVLSEQKSYPADTAKVNDLLFAIADIQVKKLINSDASDSEREAMGLLASAKDAPTVHVQVSDASGKALTGFSIGKDHKNGGSYLQKDGSRQVYQSKRNVFLAQSYKDFIDWTLVKVAADKLDKVEQSSPPITAEKLNGTWLLMDPKSSTPLPAGKPEKAGEWAGGMSRIDFEDFYPVATPELQELKFSVELRLTLSDKMVYELKLAKAKGSHYAQLSAGVADLPSEVTIDPSDDKEKLAGIENMLTAKERAERVNRQRSPWLYKISQADYERLIKKKAFFQ